MVVQMTGIILKATSEVKLFLVMLYCHPYNMIISLTGPDEPLTLRA